MKDTTNKCELYQSLLLLMEERETEVFECHMRNFVAKWKDVESGFMEYFKKNYSSRAGMSESCLVNIVTCLI